MFGERKRAFFDTPTGLTRRIVFEDSVLPLIEAGITRSIPDEGVTICEGVRFLPAFGHSAGHMAIGITSGNGRALYPGDVMHSALQVYRPQCFAFSQATRASRVNGCSAALPIRMHPSPPPTFLRRRREEFEETGMRFRGPIWIA
ncbi:hypothetical protein [Caballeronia terrestris]|uniref:hypothetical protein n=1 Tax=Caballeronia terrestris TaxID=1226301 RepID=UPI000A72915E|nr:hypothetical protein [Caballeronia terrestris]